MQPLRKREFQMANSSQDTPMHKYITLAICLLATTCCKPALSADLSKIDRTIVKEPAYQTKNPRYCLLVFGPDARTRVWLVLDGTTLYVDKTGKGDLTGPEKRVKNVNPRNARVALFRTGPIIAADGKTRCPNLLVRARHDGRFDRSPRAFIQVDLPAAFQAAGAERQRVSEETKLLFADRPSEAPILHIDGPLSIRLEEPGQVFVRGEKPSALPVMIGTPGLGTDTFAALVFESKAPAALATIAFPNRKAGGKPIVALVPLKPPD
jgi:hypothetical protein